MVETTGPIRGTADANIVLSPTKHGYIRSQPTDGDELFMFGSNRNVSLGVGDADDRQYPERIQLQRPESLYHHFYQSFAEEAGLDDDLSDSLDDIPILIKSRPLHIQEVIMSKLHTAVLTTDAVSNLYICGVGRGGRLGLGDENTQFKFAPVQGPLADKKIKSVALGQNHSMAVTSNGELWTWGLNADSQLGYTLPPPLRADEEPMSLVPRQVFGPLKKETILGVAASAIHSVAHTGSSLYCWGKNIGQLALMDADSRSLDVQPIPRRVAASLLTAPIEMVSAIDKATSCLLANCTVWVFSSYGYNLVKFPIPDVFSNHNLAVGAFTTRQDSKRRDIRYISSGGDTIAALTSRGDVYTMQVNHKIDSNQSAASTTNPAKIKGAISQPQCIWDSRKEGVVSVDVGEHGSVIICTESGSVWTRVKRSKAKTTGFTDASAAKRKDFKFQRVPYITNCVTVRSSTFGAFSAIRKDSQVMANEISVDGKTIWADLAKLLCLNDYTSPSQQPSTVYGKAWQAALDRERPGSIQAELLGTADIETELSQWLTAHKAQYEHMDMEIRSSLWPDLKIPVHSWLFSARSAPIRGSLQQLQLPSFDNGDTTDEIFSLEAMDGKKILTLHSADIFTVLNIVVFLYQDAFIPVWKHTREAPTFAHRFRHIRTEVMKFASALELGALETAARLQSSVEPSLDANFEAAIADPDYLEDGDVLIQLDGEQVLAHSQLLCERCPFFEGMFHGRSDGEWLAQRMTDDHITEPIEVDLSHIHPDTFQLVLQYLYADVADDLFKDISTSNLDEFSEIVLDVMAVANELMLDRLSQACQAVIGKFVTTRNISNLLNEISPCSVTEFKDVGLEYICLQLENMLENCLLDGLDEDVLLDLDSVVQKNQLARLPFAKSGRAELLLHETYPDLMFDIEEERRRRVREFAFKHAQKEEERKLSSSYRARIGSLDELAMSPQTPDGFRRRKSRSGRNEPFSPTLRPKDSQADMIFRMDDEAGKLDAGKSPLSMPTSPDLGPEFDNLELDNIPQLSAAWQPVKGSPMVDLSSSRDMSPATPLSTPRIPQTPNRTGAPWASPLLSAKKFDLKDIMSETNASSALTAGLQARQDSSNRPQPKMSQKERKKQLQKQAEAQAAALNEKANSKPWETVGTKTPPPWKAASPAPKTSLKDMMNSEKQRGSILANSKPLVASEASPRVRTASPDTKFSGQKAARGTTSKKEAKAPVTPHSKSYITPAKKSEAVLGLSMADIIGQQRYEQQLAKEAVAKRSLQEIQQEQAFQEWWDQETQRAQAQEASAKGRNKESTGDGNKKGRRSRGGKSSKGKENNGPAAGGSNASSGAPSNPRAIRGRSGK